MYFINTFASSLQQHPPGAVPTAEGTILDFLQEKDPGQTSLRILNTLAFNLHFCYSFIF